MVPAHDLAALVETSAQLMDGCRAFGIPAVLVMAHPLDADRLPDELRHQRRVDRGRIGTVAAVATRGLEGDDANVLDRDVEGVGDGRADDVGTLRSRPDRGRPVLDVCDRTGRADRAVRLNRGGVLRVERTCGAGERLGRVAGACNNGILEAGRLANVRVELLHGRQAGPVRPLDLELARGLDRVPFALGDDAEEVLQANDPGTVRRLAVAEQLRAEARRPDHASMQHVRHPDVLDVEMLTGHLGRDVDARHRLADDRVLARCLRRRPTEGEPEPSVLALHGDRDAEQLAVDQLAVRDLTRRVADRADDSVHDRELVCGNIELGCGQGEERPAAIRRGLPKLRAGEGNRQAAHGRPLVDAALGVAHDHPDTIEGHIELLGNDLRERRLVALAQIRLPGERGHGAVGLDGQPRVERRRIELGRPRLRRVAPALRDAPHTGRNADRDDQRAATLQERVAGEPPVLARGQVRGSHARPPPSRHA